jgi:catechol 2,3-dioxygenase-like lactoylglutathione lyase family enzyme
MSTNQSPMPLRLELIVVPVSDVDRAKSFYADLCGFTVDVDVLAGEDFRVVQLTPPGSACSITLMKNVESAGSLQGLHLVATDIEEARAQLVARGAEPGDFFHFVEGGQTEGLHPERGRYETFFSLADPDGTGWLVQEVPADQPAGEGG